MTATEQPPDAAEPVAGRYELGGVLGRGSSAEVRRARDLRDGDLVAIKLFNAECSRQDRTRQRRELELLARLRHPGLVGMRDGGAYGDQTFVVTDLVEGPTLARRIRDGALDPAEVRRIGAQLAAGLAHVHAAGVVHRDVKPANVLLGDGTHARLADFGIAVAIDGTVATDTGCIVGTVAYLSPEQARGEVVGPPTDVWSLGLVLLEALTGRREYPGTAVEAAVARLHRRPQLPADLPADLAAVLRGMTEPDPDARPSAATVARQLAGAARGGRRGAHRRAARHRRDSGPRKLLLAVASAVLAGVTGAALITLIPPQSGPPVAVVDVPAPGH
ncbi:serine/threonine-protein kinase [Pseudonocardia sp. CA-107938]|uniref:serine/threonine-protein kinase n=1 Tax=Pseudonocardia sp. CA-107938 TaxID=3240021 RepID=UPI003D8DC754